MHCTFKTFREKKNIAIEMTVFLLYTVFSQMKIMYKVSDHLLCVSIGSGFALHA